MLEHPATTIGDSRDKKIDRPKEKVNWTDFRNQKAPQRRRHVKTGLSAKKVKCNEEIPVTAKATMDSNRDYSDRAPRSADTKPIPCRKTEAHSQTSPVQCWVCMFIKSIPLINIIIMILVTSNRESNIEFLI